MGCLEDPRSVLAHLDRGDGQGDAALRPDLAYRGRFEPCPKGTSKRLAPGSQSRPTLNEVSEEAGQSGRKWPGENSGTVVSIELDDLPKGDAFRQCGTNDCAGARPDDQIKSSTKIDVLDASAKGIGFAQLREIGRRVGPSHSSAVQAQNAVGLALVWGMGFRLAQLGALLNPSSLAPQFGHDSFRLPFGGEPGLAADIEYV
jgi:hypothetical protein